MPLFQVLTQEESLRLSRRAVNIDLTEYTNFLSSIDIGFFGKVQIGLGEDRRTIKRRLTVAAHSMGLDLRYRKSGEGELIFQVCSQPVTESEDCAAGESNEGAIQPPKSKRGKAQAEEPVDLAHAAD